MGKEIIKFGDTEIEKQISLTKKTILIFFLS